MIQESRKPVDSGVFLEKMVGVPRETVRSEL
jgi:hypothetical protein